MRLIVVENLNIARKFAEALNIRAKKNFCYEGNDFRIIWILDGAGEQTNIVAPFHIHNDKIGQIIKNCDSIICATSPSLKGEKLFTQFYNDLKVELPIDRLWINSLTKKSILKGLQVLIPKSFNQKEIVKSKFRHLKKENLEFILNKDYNSTVKNISIILESDLSPNCEKIIHFGYKIQLELKKDFYMIQCFSEETWQNKLSVDEMTQLIKRKGTVNFNKQSKSIKKENPPLLYNINNLNQACKEGFGFSEIQTLHILQGLFEKGLITYPFTHSKTITNELWKHMPEILRTLNSKLSITENNGKFNWGNFDRNIVNDKNEFPIFQGIYPTGKVPYRLSQKENAVFACIAIRLMESLSVPYEYEVLNLEFSVFQHSFRTKIIKIINPGWRIFQNTFYKDGTEIVDHFPEFKLHEKVKLADLKIIHKDCIKI